MARRSTFYRAYSLLSLGPLPRQGRTDRTWLGWTLWGKGYAVRPSPNDPQPRGKLYTGPALSARSWAFLLITTTTPPPSPQSTALLFGSTMDFDSYISLVLQLKKSRSLSKTNDLSKSSVCPMLRGCPFINYRGGGGRVGGGKIKCAYGHQWSRNSRHP